MAIGTYPYARSSSSPAGHSGQSFRAPNVIRSASRSRSVLSPPLLFCPLASSSALRLTHFAYTTFTVQTQI
jgi:hypothetical protein